MALYVAMWAGHVDIIQLLREGGAGTQAMARHNVFWLA